MFVRIQNGLLVDEYHAEFIGEMAKVIVPVA